MKRESNIESGNRKINGNFVFYGKLTIFDHLVKLND